MIKYILRRIFQMIPTVLGVIFLTFILFNIVPNDLAAISLGKNVTPEMLEYYQKMETRLTSGMSNIKRSRDFGHGMETM